LKRIYFTVTNDLSFDQRMHRICGSLADAGYDVTLVGRELKTSLPLQQKSFHQKRLHCFFIKGFLFYTEYNLRLFFFLLNKKMEGICAIDLDTILPCFFISNLKSIPRVYDAHEYFTELKEVRTRPLVKKIWLAIERFAVPKYKYGYTVSNGLAEEFRKNYCRNYKVIRNLPVLKPLGITGREICLVFQGAVNEARGFEYLIPAMRSIKYKLIICGDGNFMQQLKVLIHQNNVADRVELRGMLLPEELKKIAQQAMLGLGLAEKEGLNQYLALPNKFFEYIHAGLPQVAMNFPEYQKINGQYKVAVLLDQLSIEKISEAINAVMENNSLLEELHRNCLKAREIYCWQNEEKELIKFYQTIFQSE
jgi:glycosyltransferase involved in cell wall biosynthesis